MLMELEKKDESLNHKFQNAGMKTNGIFKNASTCDLSDGMSSASHVGRYQAEFSPVSTSNNTPTNYVSPPSGFTNHDQDNKKMNSTQEAFFTPKPLNSCPKLESKEHCTGQRSSDSISENFESPAKHRTTSYWKSSSNHGRKEVTEEDTTSKPATSPILSKNLTTKALQKSVIRQTQGRKKQNNSSDSLVKCNGRSTKVYHEKNKCVIREDTQMTKILTRSHKTLRDGETDSCLKNSTNENLDQSFETSAEGNKKNNIKEESIIYTVQMSDNVDSAEKPAILSNERTSCAGHSAECYQTKFNVLSPETPTTNAITTTVSEKKEELNAGGSTTDKTKPKPGKGRKTWADMVEEEEQEERLTNENKNNKACNSRKEEQAFKSLDAQRRWTESEAFAGEAMKTILSDSGPDLKLLLSKNHTKLFGDKESQSRSGMSKRRDGSARRCLSFGQPPFLYSLDSEPKDKRLSRLKVFQEITSGDSLRQC